MLPDRLCEIFPEVIRPLEPFTNDHVGLLAQILRPNVYGYQLDAPEIAYVGGDPMLIKLFKAFRFKLSFSQNFGLEPDTNAVVPFRAVPRPVARRGRAFLSASRIDSDQLLCISVPITASGASAVLHQICVARGETGQFHFSSS